MGGPTTRARARFSFLELVFCLAVCGALTFGVAAYGPHGSADPAGALPTARERDLASQAAREHMAAVISTPFHQIESAYGEGGTFDVTPLRPAVPGQAVGSTEITPAGDDLRVTVRVVWLAQSGSADRLELQGTVARPPLEKASTAAAVSAVRPADAPCDLPFDLDAMTLITSGWVGLVALILIGAVWHRPRACSPDALEL